MGCSHRWMLLWIGTLIAVSAQMLADESWDHLQAVLARIRPPEIPQSIFEAHDFGAQADDGSDARPGIQRAVNAANAQGGGVVRLGQGVWYSKGPIHLRSNVFLRIGDDARLVFTAETDAYLPQVRSRWEGTEVYNYSPFIYAYQATNVGIIGGGVIDGNAAESFARWRGRQQDAQHRLRAMGTQGVPVHQRVFGPGRDSQGDFLRPSLVQFFGCQNVLIEGVRMIDSPMWVNHLVYCHNVTVRGVTIDSRRLNNDGVNVDSSSWVLIENCDVHTGDDGVVIKSGRDQDGWRVGRPSEWIVVRNNHIQGHNALAVGSEMSAGVRGVYMYGNTLGQVRSAVYVKSNRDRGGIVEQLRVRNITVDQADTLIRFLMDYGGYRGGNASPQFRDILVDDITAAQVDTMMEIRGISSSPIREVRLRNVEARRASQVMRIEHVEDFDMAQVRANGQPVIYHDAPETGASRE